MIIKINIGQGYWGYFWSKKSQTKPNQLKASAQDQRPWQEVKEAAEPSIIANDRLEAAPSSSPIPGWLASQYMGIYIVTQPGKAASMDSIYIVW